MIEIPEKGPFTIVAGYSGGLDTEKDKVLRNIFGDRDLGSGMNLVTGERDFSRRYHHRQLGEEVIKDLQNVRGFEVQIKVYSD